MTPDLLESAIAISLWAILVGAWVGALDQPFQLFETARWAASFGFLSVALFVINSLVLC
jgi:hypothetical protein